MNTDKTKFIKISLENLTSILLVKLCTIDRHTIRIVGSNTKAPPQNSMISINRKVTRALSNKLMFAQKHEMQSDINVNDFLKLVESHIDKSEWSKRGWKTLALYSLRTRDNVNGRTQLVQLTRLGSFHKAAKKNAVQQYEETIASDEIRDSFECLLEELTDDLGQDVDVCKELNKVDAFIGVFEQYAEIMRLTEQEQATAVNHLVTHIKRR